MSEFRNQSWDQRFTQMGDQAEAQFEKYCAETLGIGFVRYGLDRPPIAVHKLPARVRYSPDYLTSRAFVEVQGFGRDQTFKLKLDKWGALHWWNSVFPLELFVWDSHNERAALVTLPALDALLSEGHGSLDSFPEGKSYFAIRGDDIFALAA